MYCRIDKGRPYKDNDTGHEVYVDGNKVVVMDGTKQITQWADQTKAQTRNKVLDGTWTPINK
jgi:hypothetical protein